MRLSSCSASFSLAGRAVELGYDLRLVCRADEDLANPIEPSVIGGAKIAGVIAAFAAEYDWSRGRSEVFTEMSAKI